MILFYTKLNPFTNVLTPIYLWVPTFFLKPYACFCNCRQCNVEFIIKIGNPFKLKMRDLYFTVSSKALSSLLLDLYSLFISKRKASAYSMSCFSALARQGQPSIPKRQRDVLYLFFLVFPLFPSIAMWFMGYYSINSSANFCLLSALFSYDMNFFFLCLLSLPEELLLKFCNLLLHNAYY